LPKSAVDYLAEGTYLEGVAPAPGATAVISASSLRREIKR
jgi:hypothetical protein